MTDKEKLVKVVKLADAMYHSAQYLTTDASRLHKAMEEYHWFIIHEYFNEKPVSNSDWLTELQEKLDNATPEQLEELWNKYNGVDEEEPVSKLSAIKAEIERRKEINGKNLDYSDPYMRGVMACYSEVLAIFDFDFPEEPVSEDLEEAAEKYAYELCPSIGVANTEAEQSFKADAKWQKEQMIAKAIDGTARPDDNEIWCNLASSNLKDGNKVKVIVIRED